MPLPLAAAAAAAASAAAEGSVATVGIAARSDDDCAAPALCM